MAQRVSDPRRQHRFNFKYEDRRSRKLRLYEQLAFVLWNILHVTHHKTQPSNLNFSLSNEYLEHERDDPKVHMWFKDTEVTGRVFFAEIIKSSVFLEGGHDVIVYTLTLCGYHWMHSYRISGHVEEDGLVGPPVHPVSVH